MCLRSLQKYDKCFCKQKRHFNLERKILFYKMPLSLEKAELHEAQKAFDKRKQMFRIFLVFFIEHLNENIKKDEC